MQVWDRQGARNRQQGLVGRLMGLLALALAILACGAPPPPEMIPVATLEPSVAPFRVVSLAGNMLQSRTGRDGKLQWEAHIGSVGPALLTPDAGAHVVYVSASSAPMVTAVSASTGRILWQFSRCTGPDTTILLGQGRVYLTCGQTAEAGPDAIALATMYALDAQTGAVLWTAAQQHARTIADANVITQTTTGLAALNGATGAVLWRRQVDIGPQGTVPPLDAFDFVVRVGPGGLYYSPDGIYAEALQISSGALLWRSGPLRDPASAPNSTFIQHASVALATADEIVTQGIYGVTVLRTSDGTALWRHYQYPDGGGATMLVGDDGTVYVANYSGPPLVTPDPMGASQPLAALNPRDGSLRWEAPGPVAFHPLVFLSGDTLFTGEPSAFDTTNGARRWRQPYLHADYLAANASVLCLQEGPLLYALKVADGLKVWKQTLSASGRASPLLLPA